MQVIKVASSVILSLGLMVTAATSDSCVTKAASYSIRTYNVSIPFRQYKGNGFWVKGIVKSNYKMIHLRCGIKNSKGKWMDGNNFIVNPKSRRYDLEKLDSKLIFGKLKPGIYYYSILAKNRKGYKKLLVNKKFTVSYIYGKNISKPSRKLKAGTPVSLKGTIKSRFKIKKVTVGIQTSSGSWKDGFTVSKAPSSRRFSISTVDPLIKFGKLGSGSYRYRVFAMDSCGQVKEVASKSFKVYKKSSHHRSSSGNGGSSTRSGGYVLNYNSRVFNAIGAQPVSGPCGQYAMAYCRLVLDGHFKLKKKYSSYYNQLYYEYGNGSHYAYWSEANGHSKWYQRAKTCFRAVLEEIKSGRPCIINLHNNGTGNNHYVAVIGYVAGTTYDNVSLKSFIALDSGSGTRVKLRDMNYSTSDSPQAVFF